MRIDSSGNLLVGKTDQTANVAGTEIEGSGTIVSTRDNNTNMFLNRKTSDGNLIEFRKDNTVVGSIGVLSSRIYIGNTDTALFFNDSSNAVTPYNITSASQSNGVLDLGTSGTRFKDLYLSGGVTTGTESNFVSATSTNVVAKSTNGNGGYLNYSGLSSGGTTTFSVTHNGNVYAADGINLGGTGSANRLDDYEEGSYQPTITGGTSGSMTTGDSATYLLYTKIGNTVHVQGQIHITASTAVGTILVSLPFASGDTSGLAERSAGGGVIFDSSSGGVTYPTNTVDCCPYVTTGASVFQFRVSISGGGAASLSDTHIGASDRFAVSITYKTA
jgi:hypothetical protein